VRFTLSRFSTCKTTVQKQFERTHKGACTQDRMQGGCGSVTCSRVWLLSRIFIYAASVSIIVLSYLEAEEGEGIGDGKSASHSKSF
jgi:hypothetical protein